MVFASIFSKESVYSFSYMHDSALVCRTWALLRRSNAHWRGAVWVVPFVVLLSATLCISSSCAALVHPVYSSTYHLLRSILRGDKYGLICHTTAPLLLCL